MKLNYFYFHCVVFTLASAATSPSPENSIVDLINVLGRHINYPDLWCWFAAVDKNLIFQWFMNYSRSAFSLPSIWSVWAVSLRGSVVYKHRLDFTQSSTEQWNIKHSYWSCVPTSQMCTSAFTAFNLSALLRSLFFKAQFFVWVAARCVL